MIGILVISTNRYKEFLPSLFEGIKDRFLPGHPKKIFLFTDEYFDYEESESLLVEQHLIPPYGYPQATLFRYQIFKEHTQFLTKTNYLFYIDADMAVVENVGEEILGNGLTMTYHPGYYDKRGIVGNWGSKGVVPESKAWLDPSKHFGYVAGGFNGGKTNAFLLMIHVLAENILDDGSRGVIAEWHDESHLNAYLKTTNTEPVLYLTPSYCMPEPIQKRVAWGLMDLPPKILALEKTNDFRS